MKRLIAQAAIVALVIWGATSRGFTQTPSLMFLASSAGAVPWTGSTGGVPTVALGTISSPLQLPDGSAGAPSLTFASAPTTGFYNFGSNIIGWTNAGTSVGRLTNSGIWVASDTGQFSFGVSNDVLVVRDGAANTLAQRNGTNAQAQRLYETYTDASNYSRLTVRAQAGAAYQIFTDNAGTGTARALQFGTGGQVYWALGTTGNMLGITAAGGLGYGTGAGGAITQATSRTTGVTLNTVSGDITLFSAAGSATAASFTVTNSAVAVTDNILINQKSGTDLYQILITNVAAGSFKVTFFTTGGTTTEQPVFHFSVVKGANS